MKRNGQMNVGTSPPDFFKAGVAASAGHMNRMDRAGKLDHSASQRPRRPQLVGTDGRPISSASSSVSWPGYGPSCGFKAGSHSRETANLPSVCLPTNAELAGGALAIMRARSRYVYNNHPHAHGLLDKIVRRVAGKGTKFQPSMMTASGELLRQSNLELDFILRAIGVSVTPAGDSQKAFQELAMLLRLIDGESFNLKIVEARNRIRLGGQSVQYSRQWQVIDSDQLAENVSPEFLEVRKGNSVALGVEREESGRVVAYHVYDDGGTLWQGWNWRRKIVRIPADRMVHWFKKRDGTQVRGVPMLAPVLLPLSGYEEFIDSQMTAAWVQSNNTTFVKTDMPAEMQELWAGDDDRLTQAWEWGTARDYPLTEMAAGEVRFLNPFTDVKFADPTVPGPQFDMFTTGMLRSAAAGTGYSYEMLAGDYSKTNFSSGQQTSADDQATSADLAEDMDDQFLTPIYDDGLDFIFTVNGLMAEPAGARDHYEHWVQHPVRPRIDQQKEERANTEAKDNGTESVIGICKRKNLDWHDVEDERLSAEAYTRKARAALGLPEPDAVAESTAAVARLSGTVGDLASQVEALLEDRETANA